MEQKTGSTNFKDLVEARGYLESRFQGEITEKRKSVDADLVDEFDRFTDQVKSGIEGIERIPKDITPEGLWKEFLVQVYRGSEFHGKLVSKVAGEYERNLSETDSSFEIVKLAGQLAYVEGGGVHQDLEASGTLIVSSAGIKGVVEELFSEQSDVDKELGILLDDARKYVKENEITGSFVLLKKVDGVRLGFGVEIGEVGELLNVGVEEITAACRSYKFDRTIEKLPEIGGNTRLLVISNNYGDYPDYLQDPYSLPVDLFLLKSTCGRNWVPLHLENTKVGEEIKSKLSKANASQNQ